MRAKSDAKSAGVFKGETAVRLSFDGAPFEMVKYWAQRILRCFRLGGFTILRAGERQYQVVFNRRVGWDEKILIVAWVSLETNDLGLKKRFTMHCTKETSAPKASSRKDRVVPKILYRSTSRAKK